MRLNAFGKGRGCENRARELGGESEKRGERCGDLSCGNGGCWGFWSVGLGAESLVDWLVLWIHIFRILWML